MRLGNIQWDNVIQKLPWGLVPIVFLMLVWMGKRALDFQNVFDLYLSGGGTEKLDSVIEGSKAFLNDTLVFVSLLGIVFLLLCIFLFATIRRYENRMDFLRTGHNRYKFLAEGPLSIGILRLDCSSGRIVDANTGALRLFGFSRAQVVGKKISNFLKEDSTKEMERVFKNIVEGKKFFEVSCSIVNGIGEVRDIDFHVAVTGGTIEDPYGAIGKEAIAILTDVTEKRVAEEEKLKNERLRGVLEMAGGAAHELNQPLQVVLGYASLISARLDENHPLKEKAEKLRSEVERLSEIGKKIASISEYAVRDYVGNIKIIDINRASKKVKRVG